MDTLSIILAIIGIVVLVFSFWSFRLVRKHIRRFNNNSRHTSALTDEKYFELKSRQEYIIATSAIIFAVISFIGYSSLKEIKQTIADSVEKEKQKLELLYRSADTSYSNLAIKGKNYEDSVRSALQLVTVLKNRLSVISNKDVIKQNIFIVDPLKIGSFKSDQDEFRIVKFKDLTTISGQKLPEFKTPPSIVCFSTTYSMLLVTDVTSSGFKIKPTLNYSTNDDISGNNVLFSVWISSKPTGKSFNDDFSDDFN
jgi:hypothetical protein